MIKLKKYLTDGKTMILLMSSLILIAVSGACNGTSSGDLDEQAFLNAVDTAVAATDAAQEQDAQKTQVAEAILAPTETPNPTTTAAPPSATAEPSLTPTIEQEVEGTPAATQPTFSPSISGPVVQVSVDTNCRSGPGKSYTYLGGLLVGEEAVIVGKDPSGAYWYITNPDVEDGFCWIWGFYATIAGNTAPLPIYTPGPTPTPEVNFSTAVHEVETCGGAWQVEFTIVNNGLIKLESIMILVEDTVTGSSSGKKKVNQFTEKNGCTNVVSHDRIEPGDKAYIVSLDLPSDPTGHSLYVKFRTCSQDNLAGDCRIREFYVTP